MPDPGKLRGYWLKQAYGITVEDYERMLANQGGVCRHLQEDPGRLLC